MMPGPWTKSEGWTTVPVAVTAAVALSMLVWLYVSLSELTYIGWDAYPMLVTSQVSSWADLARLLTERLMEDYYPGVFYRPVASLTIAAELAVFGLKPGVSVGVQVAMLGLCAFFFFRLLRKLLPEPRWLAATGAFLLLLHPAVGTVVPYLERRPDLLVTLFLVWLLDLEATPAAPSWQRRLGGVLLALAAMGSKETGLVAPLLVAVYATTFASGGWLGRLATGFRRAIPSGVAALMYLSLRFVFLGGLGGHPRTGHPGLLSAQLHKLMSALLSPGSTQPMHWVILGAAVVTAGLSLRVVRSRRVDHGAVGRAMIFGAGWLVSLALILTAANRFSPWYAFAGVMPLCLVTVAGIGLAVRSARARGVGRWVSAGGMVLWAGVTLQMIDSSPVLTRHTELDRASAETLRFFDELRPSLQAASAGDLIKAGPYPKVVRPGGSRLGQPAVAVLAPYSIRAWAQLERPDLEIRVDRRWRVREAPPEPHEVTIAIRHGVKIRLDEWPKAD